MIYGIHSVNHKLYGSYNSNLNTLLEKLITNKTECVRLRESYTIILHYLF